MANKQLQLVAFIAELKVEIGQSEGFSTYRKLVSYRPHNTLSVARGPSFIIEKQVRLSVSNEAPVLHGSCQVKTESINRLDDFQSADLTCGKVRDRDLIHFWQRIVDAKIVFEAFEYFSRHFKCEPSLVTSDRLRLAENSLRYEARLVFNESKVGDGECNQGISANFVMRYSPSVDDDT
jgi:hypothetical protein